jgi:hypothetical protein
MSHVLCLDNGANTNSKELLQLHRFEYD